MVIYSFYRLHVLLASPAKAGSLLNFLHRIVVKVGHSSRK